jgi:predicted deacetylase
LGATVRSLVRGGGAWSVGSIYAKLFPNTARLENLTEYNRIVTVLTAMHGRGECVKVSIWGSGNKVKPGREFYCASLTEVLERLERS